MGHLTTDVLTITGLFSDEFEKSYSIDKGTLPSKFVYSGVCSTHSYVKFPFSIVCSQISHLKSSYVQSPDGFSSSSIKQLAPGITAPLSRLFN